jgi:hypothetical protein
MGQRHHKPLHPLDLPSLVTPHHHKQLLLGRHLWRLQRQSHPHHPPPPRRKQHVIAFRHPHHHQTSHLHLHPPPRKLDPHRRHHTRAPRHHLLLRDTGTFLHLLILTRARPHLPLLGLVLRWWRECGQGECYGQCCCQLGGLLGAREETCQERGKRYMIVE